MFFIKTIFDLEHLLMKCPVYFHAKQLDLRQKKMRSVTLCRQTLIHKLFTHFSITQVTLFKYTKQNFQTLE